MKLSDLTKAENPVTGSKFNVTDVKSWLPLLLGIVVLIAFITIGQKWGGRLAEKFFGVVPGAAEGEGYTDF